MPDPRTAPKSLLDEVISEMLAELQAAPEFNEETVEALRRLAVAGDLKRPALVTKAIKVAPKGDRR